MFVIITLNFDYLFMIVRAFVIILIYNPLFTVSVYFVIIDIQNILTKYMLIKLILTFCPFFCEFFKYAKCKNNI